MTLTPLSIGLGASIRHLLIVSSLATFVSACSPTADTEVSNDNVEVAAGLVINNALVNTATWYAASSSLVVNGAVPSGTLVTLKNQNTKEVLGQATAANGAWSATFSGAVMATVPCKVQATTSSVYEIVSVINAPSTCDQTVIVSNSPPNGVISSPATDVVIAQGGAVNFAATGTDPNGNTPLSFAWDFAGGAANSPVQNPGAVTFSSAGTYVVSLTVKDSLGAVDATPAQRIVTVLGTPPPPQNQLPTSNIVSPATNLTIVAGNSVNFSGFGTDPDNDVPLSYLWNFGGAAANSSLQSPGNVKFTTVGTYVVSLNVTDSRGGKNVTAATRTIVVQNTPPNLPPNAVITSPTSNVTVSVGSSVSFAGFATDPDNNVPLTYAWDFSGAAPASALQNPGAVKFLTAGTYLVSLVARDSLGLADTSAAVVAVTVTSRNRAPDSMIIQPSSDTFVNVGTTVLFSGLGTDPDGDTRLSYAWDFGGSAPLSAAQNPGPVTFNKQGTFQIKLTVTDSLGMSDLTPAVRNITVRVSGGLNSPPNGTIITPMTDQAIAIGDTVVFTGFGQDTDNNVPLAYTWNFDGAAPNVNAQNPGAIKFTRGGIYTVALTVTDSAGLPDPSPDIRTIRVGPGINNPPVGTIVTPSTNVAVTVGQSVNFTSNATDVNGNTPFTYEWNFDGAAPNTNVQNPGNVRFDRVGVYYVALTVRDSLGLKDPTPDVRVVTVDNPFVVNQAPVSAIVSPVTDITVNLGDIINFRGLAGDPDGDTALTYLWNFGPAGSSTALAPGDVPFLTPGVHRITFVATDSHGLKDPTPAVRIVTVLPVTVSSIAPVSVISSPASNVVVKTGSAVSFSGYATDADNNVPFTYNWDFDGAAPNTALQNPGSVVFSRAGTYRVRFSATDSTGLVDTTPDTRFVTVEDANTPLGNVAPNGVVTSPMTTTTLLTVGDTLLFTGIGVDPDSNRPVTYRWNFDGAAPNSADQTPGNVTFNRVGTYVVWFTVTDANGMSDPTPDLRIIVVSSRGSSNAPPNGTISSPVSDMTVGMGTTLAFSAVGSDPNNNVPFKYIWNFDGAAPNMLGANPGNITFSRAGIYKISVTVVDALGLADPTPAERIITVTGPVVNLAPRGQIQSPFQDVTIGVGDQVYFSAIGDDPDFNVPLTFIWDFGGGAPNMVGQRPGSIAFKAAGTYRVTMNVTDSLGMPDPLTDVRIINVVAAPPFNSPPVGMMIEPASNLTVTTTTLMHFIGYGIDPDGDIPLTYIWDFGGAIPNMEGQYAHNIMFPRAGTYTVRLLVADSRGLADPTPVTRVITVLGPPTPPNLPPNGTILTPASVVTINVGQSVYFTSIGTDPDGNVPLSYDWNFGGGAASSAMANPGNVTFNTAGTYFVRLTVTDSLGMPDPSPSLVTVNVFSVGNAQPIGIITSPATNLTITAGTTLTFAGTGVDPDNNVPLSFLWSMGGVAPDTNAQNPGAIKFSRVGIFKIRLYVTDSLGLTDSTPELRIITVK